MESIVARVWCAQEEGRSSLGAGGRGWNPRMVGPGKVGSYPAFPEGCSAPEVLV